jgi:methionyl-tRNA formyltransferase
VLFLERLVALVPGARLTVFTFREEPIEPAFFERIREITGRHRSAFWETRNVADPKFDTFWLDPPDLLLAVSWRYLVPRSVFSRARLGAYVFHDSLLPKYRGFAPTVWAMINGECETGVTLLEMADEVDAGQILAQRKVPIGGNDSIDTVMRRVTETYLTVLEESLPLLLNGSAPRFSQQGAATYGCKRCESDNLIDWRWPTDRIYNLIRATTRPYSGAYSYFHGKKIRIWNARRLRSAPAYAGRVPGRVVQPKYREDEAEGSVILTGDGALLVTDVQLQGEAPARATAVLKKLSDTLVSCCHGAEIELSQG